MTTTKTTDTLEQEMAEMDERIREMEAELAEGYGKPLSWEEVASTTAEELARREQRRGVLPRLIRAAKVKRLELRIQQREREIETLDTKRGEAYERLEKSKAAELKAKERREAAYGEWGFAHAAVLSSEERLKRARRELRELKGE